MQLSPQDATLFQAIGLCYHKWVKECAQTHMHAHTHLQLCILIQYTKWNRSHERRGEQLQKHTLYDRPCPSSFSPFSSPLLLLLLLLLSRLGELEQATAAYSQAVALDPLFWEAIIGRGNAHLESLTPEGAQRSMSVASSECDVPSVTQCVLYRAYYCPLPILLLPLLPFPSSPSPVPPPPIGETMPGSCT